MILQYNKNITEFSKLKFNEMEGMFSGVRAVVEFDNGYGASIIKSEFSYGGKDGLYELAVLDSTGEISYDTPITNDVLGYLTEQDVTNILKNIMDL